MKTDPTIRAAYREKMEARLEQERARLKSIRAKAREADADARIELKKNADFLEKKIDEAAGYLNEMKEAGGEAFDDLRNRLDAAYEALTDPATTDSSRGGS